MAADPSPIRFGPFELDPVAGELFRGGRRIPLKPQPIRLLHLLASRAGEVVTREDIRAALWGEGTFVDFDQGVNSAVRQLRDALHDDADRPLYVETVPRRGYRFIAPVETAANPSAAKPRGTDLNLQKALWLNIAELRLAESRGRRQRRRLVAALVVVVGICVVLAFLASGRL